MVDIDRRGLIAVAGTSFALASCAKAQETPSAQGWQGDTWGNPTTNDGPAGEAPETAFKPAYLCAVYIQLDPKKLGTFKIRHGYIDASTLTGGNEQEAVEKLLLEARDAPEAAWATKPGDILRKEKNFEGFTFGSQQRLYFVIDNENIVFDDRKDEKGLASALVRFTRYGPSAESERLSTVDRAINNSFFKVATVDALTNGPFTGKKLLTLDNWHTDSTGQLINPKDPKSYQSYSMDIRILMQTSDAGTIKVVPMVIDPDTHNNGRKP